jgi:NAD(P)H-hydrate epimerase
MTRAGEAVAEAVMKHWPEVSQSSVLIVAGKGNNGGDGFVAARKLRSNGVPARVLLLTSATELTGDAARAFRQYSEKGGQVFEIRDDAPIPEVNAGVIIDALFGIGLNAEVRGNPARVIEHLNRLSAPIVAVDIPSGINADTGAIMGVAVTATRTVTFGFAKYGHVSYPGAAHCGDLQIEEIGFAQEALMEISPKGCFFQRDDASRQIAPRKAESHKGSYGHVLVVAGSYGKSGAAILASRGALRTGAGLVTAVIPECVGGVVAGGQAELMTEPMPDRDGHFDAEQTIKRLRELIAGKSAVVAGPGMGVSDDSRELISWLIREAAQPHRPLLIDADGLNVIAAMGVAMLESASGPIVLTPHPGEMARLLGTTVPAINADRISAARQLAKATGATVLLKGARSVVITAGGQIIINSSGNPGMATAGMGDVLSGIVGALMGYGTAPDEALKLGTFIHGYAGDRLVAKKGPFGYLAGDLAVELPATFSELMM